MDPPEYHTDGEQPRPVYLTPTGTRSAAKLLEEMVSESQETAVPVQGNAPSTSLSSSSSSNFEPHRTLKRHGKSKARARGGGVDGNMGLDAGTPLPAFPPGASSTRETLPRAHSTSSRSSGDPETHRRRSYTPPLPPLPPLPSTPPPRTSETAHRPTPPPRPRSPSPPTDGPPLPVPPLPPLPVPPLPPLSVPSLPPLQDEETINLKSHHRDPSSSHPTHKKSKHVSGSLSRRLLHEFLHQHQYPQHAASSHRNRDREHEHEHDRHQRDSQYPVASADAPTDVYTDGHPTARADPTSPTDSHPHYSHTRSQSHPSHTHAHARSRSRSSDSLSAMLLMTTERLHQETTRATSAERQVAEVMVLFKNAYEAKVKLERELERVREELGLYKIQLEVAQKEIFRAQEIVDRVERQRVEAEEAALKARQRNRKLVEERAVDFAMEEGRHLGFEEGLKQGRLVTNLEEPAAYYVNAPLRPASVRLEDEVDRDLYVPRHTSESSGSGSSRSSVSYSRPVAPPKRPASTAPRTQPQRTRAASTSAPPTYPSYTSSHPHGTPPDVGKYGELLPIRTMTTPPNVRVPSTQPQPPPPMPPQQPPLTPHLHDHHHHRKRSDSHPEDITIQHGTRTDGGASSINDHMQVRDPDAPIRPISIRNRSPSVSHRSIVLPPDGYIPTLGADSMISLPPPHELSLPVPAEAPPLPPSHPAPALSSASNLQPPPPQAPSSSTRARSSSRTEADPSRVRDYAYQGHDDRSRHRHRADDAQPSAAYTTYGHHQPDSRRRGVPTSHAMSVASRHSTHLSELDLLSPPRDAPGRRHEYEYNDSRSRSRNELVDSSALRRSTRTRASSTTQPATERIVEQWRSANKDYLRPTSPESTSTSRREAAGSSSRVNPVSARNVAERPMSTEPPRLRSPDIYPRHPPRRPREIVLPAPLGDPNLLNANMARTFGAVGQEGSRSYGNPTHPSSSAAQRNLTAGTPPHAQRSTSNMTVPGIEVVTPSTHDSAPSSERTALDPILLTPDSANRPMDLPTDQSQPNSNQGLYYNPGLTSGEERISMVLPDNNLPAGFVPLSPMSGMSNLNPYPPGFAPSLPKDYPAGGLSSRFVYPSSPLAH